MSTQELRSGVEHRSGGLRSGAAWRIRASEQRIAQRSIGAEGCAAERRAWSIGAEELPHYGVEQI